MKFINLEFLFILNKKKNIYKNNLKKIKMKAQLLLVLLAVSFFSVAYSDCTACADDEVCDRITTHTGATCISTTYAADTAECAEGYTD